MKHTRDSITSLGSRVKTKKSKIKNKRIDTKTYRINNRSMSPELVKGLTMLFNKMKKTHRSRKMDTKAQ